MTAELINDASELAFVVGVNRDAFSFFIQEIFAVFDEDFWCSFGKNMISFSFRELVDN